MAAGREKSEDQSSIPPAGHTWHRLVALEGLPTDGSGMTCEVAGRRVALFRIGDEVHALDDECPHQGASLGLGIALNGEIGCPWHSWHFDLRSGRNSDGLAACVQVFPVRLIADWVEVRLSQTPSDTQPA